MKVCLFRLGFSLFASTCFCAQQKLKNIFSSGKDKPEEKDEKKPTGGVAAVAAAVEGATEVEERDSSSDEDEGDE
jgi:hypothetical protein